MKLTMRSWIAGVALASALVLAACGGGGAAGGGAAGGASLNVSTPGESLAFAPASLTAAPGDVKLTFKNGSSVQKHNWVLVKGGEAAVAAVDQAAIAAGDAAGYIPNDPNIVAKTKLLDGGASESITFKAEAGEYVFICTFPGHLAAGMKGTLSVK